MAIAIDATSTGSASATSVTVSHTCTGSDRILLVGVWAQINSDVVTGVTYAGTAMTLVNSVINASTEAVYLFILVNPASGANNIVMSKTGIDLGYVLGVSYTGAKQSAQPDASVTGSAASATSLTTTLTTVADNSWTILMMKANNGTNDPGTGTTLRLDGPNNDQTGIYDSNAAITPAGSSSLQTTAGTNRAWAHCMASFSPAVAVVTLPSSNLLLMGV